MYSYKPARVILSCKNGYFFPSSDLNPRNIKATNRRQKGIFSLITAASVMFARFVLLSVVVLTASALPIDHSSYESAGGKSGYGSASAHKKDFNVKSEHSGHDVGDHGYYGDKKASAHDAAAKDAASHKHETEAHNSGAGSKYSNDASNYNKDVKTKTYGFFDYHYVQPQYHMEQFHTDEKHAAKYSGDEHSNGQKHKDNSGYHGAGYQGYDKAQEKHGNEHSNYGEEDAGHKNYYGDKDSKYGSHADGYHGKGYDSYGRGYESAHSQPSYYQPQPHYGYEPHYSHGGYHSQPYYGFDPRF
ncbi:unnamed protein product [Caenorhabditis auriculariae]|uniref:Uncharacterized protein n=1 Tax=Caenorhabditis auriculariae TaxID=2777116 RepID=A0A8S1H6W8_9PELO|nr:unnamed protein product [Caenorhabditis auriculariae]